MKKVLIVEDEYEQVRTSFEYVNAIHLSSSLELTQAAKSQDINFSDLPNYDYIFLDITLAKKSHLDGYDILKKIESENIPVKKLVIMTGNNKISETLASKGINRHYDILNKPIDFKDLEDIFTK